MPSPDINPASPVQPLSVGNVVSAGFRLYRSHLKQYLGLAFQAALWVIIPIYGWAKSWMISGLISRLAFGELVNQPETVQNARRQLNPNLWQFFIAQFLVGFILFGVNLGLSIVQGAISAIFGRVFGEASAIAAVISFILSLVVLFVYIWFYSRVLIPEVVLALEEEIDGPAAIGRSWSLTQGHVLRLQGVVFVASLITLPLIALAMLPVFLAIGSLVAFTVNNPTAVPGADLLGFFFLMLLLAIVLFLLVSVLITPFWQAIKAVIYYDLRSRREGMGLALRDRDPRL